MGQPLLSTVSHLSCYDMDARLTFVLIFSCLISLCKCQCGENEVLNPCGTTCRPTCDNTVVACTGVCSGASCDCISGYVRDSQDNCIPFNDCPQNECPENQEWRTCGTACNPTCTDPNPFCNEVCTDPGCFCVSGFVKDDGGNCVRQEDCPQAIVFVPIKYNLTCGPDQVYIHCQRCEKTCSDRNPSCKGTCITGCFCKNDLYKAPDGRCVRSQDCPVAETIVGDNELTVEECQSDEVFVWCGWCEGSCSDPSPKCPDICTRGCVCRPPLLRHHTGHCIDEKQCQPQKCLNPKEEYGCIHGCETRCERRECARQRRCRLGCHCRRGLLRSSSGDCVPYEQCAAELQVSHGV